MKTFKTTPATLLVLIVLLCCDMVKAQQTYRLEAIHKAYYGIWPKTVTFDQQTNFYKNDTLKAKQTWHEYGKFPDLFRINFGDDTLGNAIIFRGDSAYRFKGGKLRSAEIDPNFLIYLAGGIFHDKLSAVKEKLKAKGFDISKEHTTKWGAREIFVIGAQAGDTTSNQLWYDVKSLYVVRMKRLEDGRAMDIQYEGHQKIGKSWHETIVKVIANGKLVQEEIYSNFKTNVAIDDQLFDPKAMMPRQ